MTDKELMGVVNTKIEEVKKDKTIERNIEGMEFLTALGAMTLFFAGDADHFINHDGYQNFALIEDLLLSIGAWCFSSYIFNNISQRKDPELLKEELKFLKQIKYELENGKNNYQNYTLEDFNNFINSKYQESKINGYKRVRSKTKNEI